MQIGMMSLRVDISVMFSSTIGTSPGLCGIGEAVIMNSTCSSGRPASLGAHPTNVDNGQHHHRARSIRPKVRLAVVFKSRIRTSPSTMKTGRGIASRIAR